MVKTTFLPLPCALRKRSWAQTQRPANNFHFHFFLQKVNVFFLMPTFLSNLHSLLFSPRNTAGNFSPLFNHPLQSCVENYKLTLSLSFLYYYPVLKAFDRSIKPLLMNSSYSSIHYSQLLLLT